MFNRKTEEAEWSRYSRAVSREQEREEQPEPPQEVVPPPLLQKPEAPEVHASSLAHPPQFPVLSPDMSEDVESVIGEHSSFEGTFRSEHSVRVSGQVQGELESKRAIYIEERARVNAKVSGASIVVAGSIDGQLHCPGRVEIRPSGRVLGEIFAGTLIMQEGAFFEGQLKMVKPASAEPTPAA